MTDQDRQQDGGLDIEVLETSFAALAPQANRLVERFYEELFDRHPAVKPLFEGSDIKSQQTKLLAALKLVIANVRNMEALLPALQEMGRRHEKYGAEADHYVAVAAVLLSVMAEIAGELWTGQIEKAWSDALTLIAGVMIDAYDCIGSEADEQGSAGAPGDVERRAADRPWTGPKAVAGTPDESQIVTQKEIRSKR